MAAFYLSGSHTLLLKLLQTTYQFKYLTHFCRVDSDADGELNSDELEYWIMDKVNAHLDEALEENDHIFKHLDPDSDGICFISIIYMRIEIVNVSSL